MTARLARGALALLAALAIGTAAAARAEEAPPPLRLCADPANLPFSSDHGDKPGLYVEIGTVLAHAIGREASTVWTLTYFGKRAVRTTLLAGACDAEVGLPADPDFMGPRLIFSHPVLHVGYALVTPKALRVTRLADLAGKRVAVQFRSTPQNIIAAHDDITALTVLDPEEAMRALAGGHADAAFIWGPVAGYVNHTALHDEFRVTPVGGEGMQWPAAVGFARKDAALRDAFDAAIDRSTDAIAALARDYGFPTDKPIDLAALEAPPIHLAGANAPGGDPAAGHELFNGNCAHCHGPDAVQADRHINLRLLRHRYGDEMDQRFNATVRAGRPSKGMPSWEGVYTDAQFADILAYLHSVQTPE